MLDTLDNVKLGLLISGTADDAVLTKLMAAAESFIEQHTGRAFAGGTFTEFHPAGRTVVFLRNFPVDTITTLRVDANRVFGTETARAADSFVVHSDRGVIESLTGPFLKPKPDAGPDDWPAAVKVTYTTATGQVPAAVKDAFGQLVGHWYRQAKTHAGTGYEMLTELTSGTDTKTYPASLTTGLGLPAGVLQLLHPFRVPAV